MCLAQSILGDIWKGKVISSEVSYNSFSKVGSLESIAGNKNLFVLKTPIVTQGYLYVLKF